jgi:hypothetical protein
VEEVVATLKELSRNQRTGTEKNHRKCDSRNSASRRTFEKTPAGHKSESAPSEQTSSTQYSLLISN